MLDRIRLILFAFEEEIVSERELASVLELYETLSVSKREELVYPRCTSRLDNGPDRQGNSLY